MKRLWMWWGNFRSRGGIFLNKNALLLIFFRFSTSVTTGERSSRLTTITQFSTRTTKKEPKWETRWLLHNFFRHNLTPFGYNLHNFPSLFWNLEPKFSRQLQLLSHNLRPFDHNLHNFPILFWNLVLKFGTNCNPKFVDP